MRHRVESTSEAASRLAGPRRPRRRTSAWRRVGVWTGGALLALACLAALVTVPAVVLAACGVVLLAAVFWRSRSPRSGGAGLVPSALVWTALVVLVLSIGATVLHGGLPGGGFDWAAAGRSRQAADGASSPVPDASPTAPASEGGPAPSASHGPTPALAAPTQGLPSQTTPTPAPSDTAPAAPRSATPSGATAGGAAAVQPPVPTPNPTTTAAPAPAPASPSPTACSRNLIGGLLGGTSCH